jgi:hypothetical protein
MIMNIRTLAASVLALGLLAPVGAMADNNYCSQDQLGRGDFIDCKAGNVGNTAVFGAAAVDDRVVRGPVGDFIDETPAESNQRSSN